MILLHNQQVTMWCSSDSLSKHKHIKRWYKENIERRGVGKKHWEILPAENTNCQGESCIPCWTTSPWGSRWWERSWPPRWRWAAGQTGRGSASSSHRCRFCRRGRAPAWASCCPGWWWHTAPAPSAGWAQHRARHTGNINRCWKGEREKEKKQTYRLYSSMLLG